MPNLTPFLDELVIPPVVKPYGNIFTAKHLALKAKVKNLQLHQQLPPTEVWSYRLSEGTLVSFGFGTSYLGPTVVVNKSDFVQVRWENKISASGTSTGKLPYEVVKIDPSRVPGNVPQNVPGKQGALTDMEDSVRPKLRSLEAALVTHLHGARVQPDSDGWPDNTIISGQTAYFSYHNDQSSTLLWYHDHANHVTRLNVYAGLAGAWIIRDEEEFSLDLPDGEFELPIIIQDRNLDLDAAGNFTGALLHKTEVNGGPAEFFGPFSLVNGKIWPKATVEPRLYRLRVLNGSNARTYRLMLLDANGASQHGKIWQIGGDQGLMENKVNFPSSGLALAPGERLDLLVDFSSFKDQRLFLWNTAEAPFGNDPAYLPNVVTELAALLSNTQSVNDDSRRPYPQIMCFDVKAFASGLSHHVPADPLWKVMRPSLNYSVDMSIRLMALVEKPPQTPFDTAMLVFWEYVRSHDVTPPPGADEIDFSYIHPATNLAVTEKFWKAAEEFYDRINWFVHLNSTEQWYIVNLSPDTHPIHVHLVEVSVNQQSNYDVYTDGSLVPLAPAAGERTTVIDGTINPLTGKNVQIVNKIVATTARLIPLDQTAPKDTVRVDPGEMIGIGINFGPYTGKYIYHCHILEHEDDDMMRPFVIVPKFVPHHGH